MKQTPDFDKIQENMRAGSITGPGFLGHDERNLVDIISEDQAKVKELGLTNEIIANKLEMFMKQGERGFGSPVKVDDRFVVIVEESRGYIPCPFRHGHLSKKANINVRNIARKEEVDYSPISIHLIREHGFYQGKGSPYRLDPAKVAKILELI
ncbi:hypothetical protein V512_000845 [Mesotoga sp. Brook.08.105.5.1]|uniref:Uncharacterized protein n=1 Tax=Mesotoga prima TaxID=1184387 RepID=A0A101HM12_9BACT|nr:hypothetical protein [Mesotoga sp. Brook.08.105.5.1]KUK79295.1 MAG: Uncharacterized protein XD94_1424 [Mesotoga prima]PVD15493.1 hypothetical protein V512_000845 [Mesotoga sp. Brook.08.105.5.1]